MHPQARYTASEMRSKGDTTARWGRDRVNANLFRSQIRQKKFRRRPIQTLRRRKSTSALSFTALRGEFSILAAARPLVNQAALMASAASSRP
jgi:hypothetical protein